MNIINLKNKLKKMTFQEVCFKGARKIFTRINDKQNRHLDLNKDRRLINKDIKINYSYIDINSLNILKIDKLVAKYLCDKYLSHEFDLLGSGWIKIAYNTKAKGLEDYKYNMNLSINEFDERGNWLYKIIPNSYLDFSKYIWNSVTAYYEPIDWQLDFKSGYRYSSKKWYKDQRLDNKLGVDIKVPWELSRMQHLFQMAVLSIILEDYRGMIILEFKNQVIDFLATNPSRLGVNWACTMDVAIRISNILLAYDILKQLDINNLLDANFEEILSNATYEYGDFIIHNLEWNGKNSGNHYLSNVVGLLFVSAYLNRSEVTDSWLAFSVQEIIECFYNQFYEDGTNFEASTSYHRLSGELLIYPTALIYGLLKFDKANALKEYKPNLVKRLRDINKQKYNIVDSTFFPKWYLERLFKTACFTEELIKGNNKILQIGDNDSGRFIRLSPIGEFITWKDAYEKYYNLKNYIEKKNNVDLYFDEDILNHLPYISAVSGIINCDIFKKSSNEYPLEKSLIETLAKGIKFNYEKSYNKVTLNEQEINNLHFTKITEVNFKNYNADDIDLSIVKLISYPNFGLYIFKSKQLSLSVMAGENRQNGNGGHAHNDKLSFELNVHGEDLIVDPGTYLYTPIVERRNQFRSIKVHNVPIVNDEEQNEFLGTFAIKHETKCSVLSCSNTYIKVYLTYRDVKITREIEILSKKIIIKDSSNKQFKVNFNNTINSNGYGKLVINI